MDPQLKENPTPSEGSEDAQETLVPADPSEATPAPIEQRSLRGAHETTDTKKIKKKESNEKYYKKIREKLKQADVSTPASPPEPEPATPLATPPAKPPAKPPKTRAKKAKPKQEESSDSEEPLQRTPPASPRTRMIEAYREARLADQERKRLRYKSWFN